MVKIPKRMLGKVNFSFIFGVTKPLNTREVANLSATYPVVGLLSSLWE